jgi:hypothetical protein
MWEYEGKTARFWVFVNGDAVKLSLRKGQTLSYSVGCSTDEGWERTTYVWEFDGQFVSEQYDWDGRDCDGRMSRSAEYVCHVEELPNGNETECAKYPLWKEAKSERRDFAAEAAGY